MLPILLIILATIFGDSAEVLFHEDLWCRISDMQNIIVEFISSLNN